MNGTWIVAVDHPYYPSIVYCDCEATAEETAKAEYEWLNDDDGRYHLIITIAEIKQQEEGKSHY